MDRLALVGRCRQHLRELEHLDQSFAVVWKKIDCAGYGIFDKVGYWWLGIKVFTLASAPLPMPADNWCAPDRLWIFVNSSYLARGFILKLHTAGMRYACIYIKSHNYSKYQAGISTSLLLKALKWEWGSKILEKNEQ